MEHETISSHVPTDFHPSVAKHPNAKAALDNVNRVWHMLGEYNVQVKKQPAMKDQLAQHAMPVVERLVSHVGADIDRLNNELATLDSAILSALSVKPEHRQYEAEIRAHYRASKNTASALLDAARNGDQTSVAAMLAAPLILSGLDEKQHATVKEIAGKLFAPKQSAAREAIAKDIERTARALERFQQYFAERMHEWQPGPKAFAPLKQVQFGGPKT